MKISSITYIVGRGAETVYSTESQPIEEADIIVGSQEDYSDNRYVQREIREIWYRKKEDDGSYMYYNPRYIVAIHYIQQDEKEKMTNDND